MFKYEVGEFVFAKFRGKSDIGRIESAIRRGKDISYMVSFEGAKHFQERGQEEIKPMVNVR